MLTCLVFFPPPFLALLAQIADGAIGDPDWLWRALRHPVCWFGALLTWLEQRLNRPKSSFVQRRLAGFAALLALLTLTLAVALAISWCARLLPFGWMIEALLASTLIAQRSLHWHVAAVAKALEQEGITAGRRAVAMIVGRDPDTLDEPAICRAALESLAENFSDGVTAPILWLAVAGLPGIALYKAINTADSMIGHRTQRYHAFGWAAARLDDLVNLPASRLSGLLIALAALLMRGAGAAGGSLRALRRDASSHRSPNAGWPEAALAGALGVRLAGPRRYGGILVQDRWMGAGRMTPDPSDIRQGLRVFVCACWLLGGLLMLFSCVQAARDRGTMAFLELCAHDPR